jgi:hypothetical protein
MEPAIEGTDDGRIAALESQLLAVAGLVTDLAEAQRSESMRRQEASEAALAQSVDEARLTESLAAVVEVVRSELEAVATGLAETRSVLDASRAELYDALHEGVTQARLEVASLAQQLRKTEAAVARLAERQGGEVTPAPAESPAPVRPSLLDDLDRQLQEAETRLARRLSTRER